VATKSANKAAITIVGIIALVLDLLDLALSI
jgi:hypothetical protein